MPRRLMPDDEVRRFNAVYLGPKGWTLLWHARYSAYGTGAAIFVAILLVEALTPLSVGKPPIWEIAFTVLGTTLLMTAVDHDKPVQAVLSNLANVYRHRDPGEAPEHVQPRARMIKTTKDPIA